MSSDLEIQYHLTLANLKAIEREQNECVEQILHLREMLSKPQAVTPVAADMEQVSERPSSSRYYAGSRSSSAANPGVSSGGSVANNSLIQHKIPHGAFSSSARVSEAAALASMGRLFECQRAELGQAHFVGHQQVQGTSMKADNEGANDNVGNTPALKDRREVKVAEEYVGTMVSGTKKRKKPENDGGDIKAGKIHTLKEKYFEVFKKNPRGRFAGNEKWLRKKLAGAVNVREGTGEKPFSPIEFEITPPRAL